MGFLPFLYLGVPILKGRPKIETWCRNFIWSGDIQYRKLAIVAWKSCCYDLKDERLGIRSLRETNEANNLVQCWSIMNAIDSWVTIIKARVFRKGHIRKSHVFSSIWTGCKEAYEDLMEHSMWTIGKGDKMNLWRDNWCGLIIAPLLHVPADRLSLLKA
ncbi:hypothetical protein KIW84_034009 [Lathyrus oleraceus]|uniref:Uncharacterized protein n=1 Tax=Pisum sativum TaxID=3888 RepID=A0A9D4XZJ9_PEA|nr:hypothetical protein KIW84_034009 [Pisum sativum]